MTDNATLDQMLLELLEVEERMDEAECAGGLLTALYERRSGLERAMEEAAKKGAEG
jgi:hypothetical protein